MRKFCLAILLTIIIAVNAKASADTLITKLINTVYKEIVDPKAKFYYLYEFANSPKFDKYDLFDIKSIAISEEMPLNDFIESAKIDTGKSNWANYDLLKARVVSQSPVKYHDSYRIINYLPIKTSDSVMQTFRNKGIVPVRTKRNYSAKRLKIEETKAIKLYKNSISTEDKYLYQFTRPIFSKDKTFVLIGLNSSDHGCLYIFKWINGEWIKMLQYKCWVA